MRSSLDTAGTLKKSLLSQSYHSCARTFEISRLWNLVRQIKLVSSVYKNS